MNTIQPLDSFSYDYQKHFVRSFVIGMPDRKLKRVAMYHFNNSRAELADKTAEVVAGDKAVFDDFLQHFPLSWHESIGINNRILHYALINGRIPDSENGSFAMTSMLK